MAAFDDSEEKTVLNKRQKTILGALNSDLGGRATLREISEITGLSVNGLSQTFNNAGAIQPYIRRLGGEGGKAEVELVSLDWQNPNNRRHKTVANQGRLI
ncbi:MAG: hypothetical protein V1756_02300 [Patescibacteria group bacterium]